MYFAQEVDIIDVLPYAKGSDFNSDSRKRWEQCKREFQVRFSSSHISSCFDPLSSYNPFPNSCLLSNLLKIFYFYISPVITLETIEIKTIKINEFILTILSALLCTQKMTKYVITKSNCAVRNQIDKNCMSLFFY